MCAGAGGRALCGVGARVRERLLGCAAGLPLRRGALGCAVGCVVGAGPACGCGCVGGARWRVWWVPGAGPPGRRPGPYIYGAIDRGRWVGRRLAPQIHVSVQDTTPATPPPPASSASMPRWHRAPARPASSPEARCWAGAAATPHPSRRPAATADDTGRLPGPRPAPGPGAGRRWQRPPTPPAVPRPPPMTPGARPAHVQPQGRVLGGGGNDPHSLPSSCGHPPVAPGACPAPASPGVGAPRPLPPSRDHLPVARAACPVPDRPRTSAALAGDRAAMTPAPPWWPSRGRVLGGDGRGPRPPSSSASGRQWHTPGAGEVWIGWVVGWRGVCETYLEPFGALRPRA
ncbi:hypothetical protein SHXM_04737 [Streptomyces hygroscopicus]|nr:hypothetical protein SHXM_04737 [Streptomyces hygroscopicus]